MPKLTQSHRVILSAAAQRADATALPLPEQLTLNEGNITSALKALIKRGFLAEQPAKDDDETWRESEDGQRIALVITIAGLDAIGVNPKKGSGASAGVTAKPKRSTGLKKPVGCGPESPRPARAIRSGTKQALVVDMLERGGGATIAELVEATGWQSHSVRGTMSGAVKKKLGLLVESEIIDDRGGVYRITGTA